MPLSPSAIVVGMQPSDQSSLSFFDASSGIADFATAIRGYDKHQVNEHLQRLSTELQQTHAGKAEAEQRLTDAQHRLRAVEQQLSGLQQQLRSQQKQLQENQRPTLTGIGTSIEQLLRLAD